MSIKTIFNEWLSYLRDNPNRLWFKRKLYGWGWVPVKWQGWLVVVLLVAYIVFLSLNLDLSSEADLSLFFLQLIIGILVVIIICYIKGEKPAWQWGLPIMNKK